MTPADLIGTWKLVGYHHRTAAGAELDAAFGPEPMGLIHFHPNGRMIVVIVDSRMRLPDTVGQRPFSGYTARWSFDGKILTNEIDESFLTHFIGSVQRREVSCADGRMSLIPPPLVIDGVINYRELVWEKIRGT